MEIERTALHGVLLVRPKPFRDERGFFVRTSDSELMLAAGIDTNAFVQENQSRTQRGTIRGLHMRADLSETKLVRCPRGELLEHVVDLRPWSPTYLATLTVTLDDVDCLQILVPGGCAHGFTPRSVDADTCYRHTARYEPSLERAVRYDDPTFGFDWGVAEPVLSARDEAAPSFADIEAQLTSWYPRPD